jgi:hypothetical protein
MLDRATSRFADPLSNAGPGTAPVPHLSWTVGETGAHVLAAQRMYCRMLDGEPGIPTCCGSTARSRSSRGSCSSPVAGRGSARGLPV